MKLRDVAKGTWAVKPLTLRLANATEAPLPGEPPSGAPVEWKLAVRVLLGAETAEVYEKATRDAQAKGVPAWKDEDPLCRLYLMAHTLALAGVDVDPVSGLPPDPKNPARCFESAEEILASDRLGTENIVWLFQQWEQWQDELSPNFRKLSLEETMGLVFRELKNEEGEPDFLAELPHATLCGFAHITAGLLRNALRGSSLSGSPGTSSTESQKTSEPNAPSGQGESH